MKILEFYTINKKNHSIAWENNANHETPRIQLENYENHRNLWENNENHENHRIPLENYENNLKQRIPSENIENHWNLKIICENQKKMNTWNSIKELWKSWKS